jgi:hypothetical protein
MQNPDANSAPLTLGLTMPPPNASSAPRQRNLLLGLKILKPVLGSHVQLETSWMPNLAAKSAPPTLGLKMPPPNASNAARQSNLRPDLNLLEPVYGLLARLENSWITNLDAKSALPIPGLLSVLTSVSTALLQKNLPSDPSQSMPVHGSPVLLANT